ncbi:unnamed protein product [Toxocara canis]|uniref:UBIQUITIN_CONJUGAT_2 domain-containing protein n=1 Tax=Toxocara canis TaxID=6265 RepID=A0A183V432_TOXCA|nr:unnamed protein product [Toxocara canis]
MGSKPAVRRKCQTWGGEKTGLELRAGLDEPAVTPIVFRLNIASPFEFFVNRELDLFIMKLIYEESNGYPTLF